ncbi:MAG: aminotransferase class I/II-fold pyridoxal phosphate-dependent enzyme [Planctomycetes bacterium]|nr:aminotransferase class I/II-fold pyridoxal phosphate-dependent enzyme [Planctomycetota bacterium]
MINDLETKVIHAGEPEERICGAVAMPVFQSSTFESGDDAGYHDLRYIRLNNTPNHEVLHRKLAAIEGGGAALVAASGMAAITTSLLTVLQAGDHLLAQSCLYGGTHHFITQDLERFGISHSLIDADDPASWKAQLRANTKAIYVETITNPLIQVGDLTAVTQFAKDNGLISMIDNTFASPVNFQPLAQGFDLSLHSCTKYLNGHSDIVGGAAIGSAELIEGIRHKLNHLGGSMDPHTCFLLQRGIKTLVLRVRHQNGSALKIARFLDQHERVAKVYYPGLETHPQYRRACELFSGFGGMLSFELKGDAASAQRFIQDVTLPISAPSLGGVDSLITRPASTSHAGMTAKDREAMGISDSLIRLSVGIESTQDLIADFERALNR